MPKIEGREPKRVTVPSTEGIVVASFIMQHEERYWRRKCVIEGCDHRMGPKTDEPGWATNWKSCDENALPAFVVRSSAIMEPLGMTCPCHTAEVLEANWPA